ncbi:hypothetical protein E2C01_039437 [Portunus trituberculatus]|uniref:Uncharacterized protein n=1 Tax=Portunus trituberculatus TaxID=210409 RepID=A0A5B7FEQ9_PORTR|nr:hypothetical protein [Portunus trituberculatus]
MKIPMCSSKRESLCLSEPFGEEGGERGSQGKGGNRVLGRGKRPGIIFTSSAITSLSYSYVLDTMLFPLNF